VKSEFVHLTENKSPLGDLGVKIKNERDENNSKKLSNNACMDG